jgi:hypothetical protein
MSSMRCVGSVSRAAIQSISRSLFHLEPAADALDAKVQSSDLFCERLITGDGKRFVVRANEKADRVGRTRKSVLNTVELSRLGIRTST